MKQRRLHLLGASGSGTSTLGRALASKLDCPWVDSDVIFWERTEPPFTTMRKAPEREQLLRERLAPGASWVVSGSMVGWGDFLRTEFTHLIFLSLQKETRLERIRAREQERYGARLEPGGDMHQLHQDFLAWAKLYDAGGREVRSRALHEYWMRSLPCPVLRVDGMLPTEEQTKIVLAELSRDFDPLEIDMYEGISGGPVIEPFYQRLGRPKTLARPCDIFFVARSGAKVIGAVRYCVEEGVSLLRGMLIAEEARKKGVGQKLLKAFDRFVREKGITPLYCVPHAHLESFYGAIGFHAIPSTDGPAFLNQRVKEYRAEGMADAILMRRG